MSPAILDPTAENLNSIPLDKVFESVDPDTLILIEKGEGKKILLWFSGYSSFTIKSFGYSILSKRFVSGISRSCIQGTHRIDFDWDPEFNIFLPSSWDENFFFDRAHLLEDGVSETIDSSQIRVVLDFDIICKALKEIVPPRYFHEIITAFMEKKPTRLEPPRWKERPQEKTHLLKLQEQYEKAVDRISHGSFAYVGCKEEVYLLCVAKDELGRPYMQRTYTTSTKPIFYFSNNYLGNNSRFMKFDLPGFEGRPFVYPEMGRSQDCKNSIFTGEPEVITGKLKGALAHFLTTDFAEYSDVVVKYARTPEFVHPSFERRYRYFI